MTGSLIDPRTLLLVSTVLGLFCALVLWVQARSFPADIQGLDYWALAVLLIGCAAGLSSMRGIFSDLATIVGGNALLLLGQLLLIVGLQLYSGRAPSWRPALDMIAAISLMMIWLTYGTPHYPARTFLMALAHIGLFSMGAVLAWRTQPRGLGSRFLFGFFLIGIAVALWRLHTLTASTPPSDEAFDRTAIQQAYLAMFSLGVLGISMGLILLTNERLRGELEVMATRDPLTGAYNRRAFFARAGVEWARSLRARRPLAIIAADIDFFKKINDGHGHHIGDRVIQDFTERAAAMLRLPDILARFGGEEFVILLPDSGREEAGKVAERLRREIATPRNTELPAYTVSLGVAVAQGQAGHAADVEALIAQADQALYRAKQNGRNRVESA